MGYLLLINIIDYAAHIERKGSEIDQAMVSSTFEGLGFKLYKDKVHKDLNGRQIVSLIQKFAKDDIHKSVSCSAVFIMAHGDSGGIDCSISCIVQYLCQT